MKKYKITELGETSQYKKGQIITEKDFDISWLELGVKIGCMEEVKEEGKKWRAKKKGEGFFYVGTGGGIDDDYDFYSEYDDYRYLIGNYFQTPEQAQQKKDRDLAIARVNDRIRELQGGEMSMEEMMDSTLIKCEIYYDKYDKKYKDSNNSNYFIPILLRIRTQQTAQQIIKEHKNDLDIIWGIKD